MSPGAEAHVVNAFDDPPERSATDSYKWQKYGPDVLPLWVADMDFAAPPAAIAALRQRVDHGVYGYGMVPSTLTAAIRDHLASQYGWQIDPEWLVYLPGVVPALNLVSRAFAGAGEAVMTVVPAYPPFLSAPANQGRRLITVPAYLHEGRWRLPLEQMEAALAPQTRLFLFCHPHNPLGRAFSREEVVAVVDFCRRHDLILCSDEIHCDLRLDDVCHVPAATAGGDAAEFTVTLMSPSKTFNLPGLNFAFAVIANAALRQRFQTAAAGLLPMPSPLAVAAAEAAYREGAEWLVALLAYLRGNAAVVERFVAELLPTVTTTHVEATYLAWLDVRAAALPNAHEACLRAGVALNDGADFGAPGFLRLNFACSRSTLDEGLRRLQRALHVAPTGPGGSRRRAAAGPTAAGEPTAGQPVGGGS